MSAKFNKESFDQKWEQSESGCWEWKATKNGDGYGRVRRLGKLESAHRVSYELYRGPLKGLHVLHECDNPGCVNPAHLFLGTHKENQEDKARKGRSGGIKLTALDVSKIRNDNRVQTQIAADYGISQSAVSLIKRRVNWTHV